MRKASDANRCPSSRTGSVNEKGLKKEKKKIIYEFLRLENSLEMKNKKKYFRMVMLEKDDSSNNPEA